MNTADSFTRLAAALRTRLAVIADRGLYNQSPAKHLTALKSASQEINEAAAALPQPIDPQLQHFIQRQSYDKALEWLEARAPN